MKTKLKTKTNQAITNITVQKSAVRDFKSDAGHEFKIVTIGEHEIMFQPKWVSENKTGTMSVGIKNNFEYNIFKTDSSVNGVDLTAYFFALKEEEKQDTKADKKSKAKK